VQSRYSRTDGTFVDSIQTANTEEQCMVRTYQENIQRGILSQKWDNHRGNMLIDRD